MNGLEFSRTLCLIILQQGVEEDVGREASMVTCRPYLGNNDIETQAQYTVTDHIVGDVLSLHLPIEDLELV